VGGMDKLERLPDEWVRLLKAGGRPDSKGLVPSPRKRRERGGQGSSTRTHAADSRERLPARPPATKRVNFSLTGPTTMVPGRSYVLEVWAYLDAHHKEVLKRARRGRKAGEVSVQTKSGVLVERGATITVRVNIPDFQVHDAED